MSFQLVFASLSTVAATAEKSAAPSSIATLASMVGGLIVVLLLIFALAYMVKRLNLVPSSQGVLKTLAVTPLGQKEKLVLVEVDGQQYLLGVTPHQVNVVDKLTTPVQLSKDSFASRLRQAKTSQ
ncbi:flagellar biosynthetic protein FliO [Shewanella abyssi]|uniref:flagellar biosynthetic protein FliO n=1 Tax=Shewanella abyssi TaxID=311789 RepID=UPI00200D7BB2|nr:flagellar biosynthetic protein FliO [Shewanella abyssi]MCL1050692.1 flagellar biosynthetic protein FliO [Shewanella abyssi]